MAMLLALIVAVLLLVVLLGIVWKLRSDLAVVQQQVAGSQTLAADVASVKTQMQALPVALGDLGAVKSQVQHVAAALQDLGGIKSQVESISGHAQSIGGIRAQVEIINSAVQQLEAIKSQIETLSGTTETIGGIKSQVEAITQTVQQLGSIRTDLEHVKSREAQLGETINRIANKLIGTRDVGEAGENILAEAFAQFPPGWIETDFKVGGKTVEFALVLPNQKRLPIDSKFPAVLPLERLGEETGAEQRQKIIQEIEAAIYSKAQEAAKYIDPARTIPLAVAAIPDAAYSVCRKAHYQAIGKDVLVISYSMALPLILALYRFQLQFSTSIDQQNLENYLKNIESCLKVMEDQFENRVKEAGTRIGNAYAECTVQIGKIRAALSALRAPSLPQQELQEGAELRLP
ncbi:MAG TPA: DNA recombination protein RmuC [Terriglobia bacterium]|nr:DNA recombination protein RmuC [Terriglobia bacterium]